MFGKKSDKNAQLKRIIKLTEDITDKKERMWIADLAVNIYLSGRNIAGSLESALEQAKNLRKDYLAFVSGDLSAVKD